MGKRRKGPARILVLAVLAVAWVFFAPAQLGGSTLYSATVGNSMEPLFHKGDLAILRSGGPYRVGDIVLYQSPVLHRPVLHRIRVIENDHYFFKGDNNDFVDPGYATSGDLLGKLWIHLPKAGKVLSWFGAPLHTALLAAISVVFLLLGGGAKKGRRRRERSSAGRPRPAVPRRQMRIAQSRRFIHRPRKTVENIVGMTALGLAVVLLVAGFGAPLARTVSATGFRNTGTFSYNAKVLRPDAAYPSGFARSGQPVFLNAFKTISLRFAYRFNSKFSHHVRGTVSLKALISSDTDFRHLYTLEAPRRFSGDSVSVGGNFDLQQLKALLSQISLETGKAGSTFTVDLQPVVHVTGTVIGHPIDSTFSPVLPFTATEVALKLNVTAPAAPPGATYAPPSAASTLAAGLHPHSSGTIPTRAPNFLLIARYHLAVSAVRGLGLAMAAFALLALIGKFFKPKREVWSLEKRIATRYGCVVVDVVSIASAAATALSTEIPDFEALATLAQYCERPILRETRGPHPAYAVEDAGRLYVYRPAVLPRANRTTVAEAS